MEGCPRNPLHQHQRQHQPQQQRQEMEQKQQHLERPLSTLTAKLKGLPRRMRGEEEKLRRHLRVACASERACAREKGGGSIDTVKHTEYLVL